MKEKLHSSIISFKNNFEKFKHNKQAMYTLSVSVLILFCLALNIAFSSFNHTASNMAANIKIKNMEYHMTINSKEDTIIAAASNDVDIFNIALASLNTMDSKYELIYHVCSDQNCENYIDKPEGLTIDYSSKTTDPITGSITSTGTKTMRIISTNTTANTLYVKLDINAGYSYNTLALKNMISNEYDESDVSIIAYVNGTLASAFPSTNKYRSYVSCTVNGSATTATGTSIWNGPEWVVTLNNIKANNTRCNVSFVNPEPLYQAILNDNGGADSITTKDSFVSGKILQLIWVYLKCPITMEQVIIIGEQLIPIG